MASIAVMWLATDSPNRGVMNDKEAKADPWGVATTRLPVVDLPSDNRQTECVWDSFAKRDDNGNVERVTCGRGSRGTVT